MKKKMLKEFGDAEVSIRDYFTQHHIKEITRRYILLEDRCPKNPKKYSSGDVFKIMINPNDKDDTKFREKCKKIVEWSKKHNRCPELSIHCQLGARLIELT